MSRRERVVMVEARGSGMVLIMLRAADEVRAPQFMKAEGAIDADMLAIARTLIERRIGKFDPTKFQDRYLEALQELIETKIKGLPIKPRAVAAPAPVTDLMTALKRSLAGETPTAEVVGIEYFCRERWYPPVYPAASWSCTARLFNHHLH